METYVLDDNILLNSCYIRKCFRRKLWLECNMYFIVSNISRNSRILQDNVKNISKFDIGHK